MPYGTPTSKPAAATYSVGLVSPDGVQVDLSISLPVIGATEDAKDAAFQAAVDAVAGLPGWTFTGGFKNYTTQEEITVTP